MVEDDLLVADLVADMLEELDYIPVGPAPSLERAYELLEHEALDGAILDLNLNGVPVFPLAERCLALNIPVVLATGYADKSIMPESCRDLPSLEKPFHFETLRATLQTALLQSSRTGCTVPE
ncbi:MAG: response regulator [Alphaproteobacteria bacterium]